MIKNRKKEIASNRVSFKDTNLNLDELEYDPDKKSWFDYIYPEGIDVTYEKFVKIDGTFIASVICYNIMSENAFLLFKSIINKGEGIEFFMKVVPQNKVKTIRALAKYINIGEVDLRSGGGTDAEAISSAVESGKYIRKRLAKGDEFFHFHPIIKIVAEDEESFKSKLRFVEGELAAKNIAYRYANYKQLETFLTTVPGCREDAGTLDISQRNITSSDLAGIYPFASASLTDSGGVLLGVNEHDKRPAMLNQFDTKKYMNANMIIVGSSGSGKTFTTQMITGRYRMKKIPVMMICPFKGHEYAPLCQAIGGNFIKFVTSGENDKSMNINCMDIRPYKTLAGEEESYLSAKIKSLKILIQLMVPTITETEVMLLEDPIIKTYAERGIGMENSSIYEGLSGGAFSLNAKIKEMPLLEDLIRNLAQVPKLEHIAELMQPFISGSYSFFNKKTNIDIENPYTVSDISELPEEVVPIAMFLILEIYLWKARKNLSEYKVIVIDEIWKLIAYSEAAAKRILELYKIVRGYGCGIIGATQDAADFFALKDGYYGKGIINNSAIKIIMKSEAVGVEALKPVLKMTDMEAMSVEKLGRGSGLVYAGSNHLLVNFVPFKTEERLINTDVNKRREYEKDV